MSKRCDSCGDRIRSRPRTLREWSKQRNVGPLYRVSLRGVHAMTRREFEQLIAGMDKRSAARLIATQDLKWLAKIGWRA